MLLIFFCSSVLATCSSGQIDLNTASLVELDKLVGIGEATLAKIKEQNLACVSTEEKKSVEKEKDNEEKITYSPIEN